MPHREVSHIVDVLRDVLPEVPEIDKPNQFSPQHSHGSHLRRMLPLLASLTVGQLASVEDAIVHAARDGALNGWSQGVLRMIVLGVADSYDRARTDRLSDLLAILSGYPPSHIAMMVDRFRDDLAEYKKRFKRTRKAFGDGLDELIAQDPGRNAMLRKIAGMIAGLPNSKLEPLACFMRSKLNPSEADPQAPLDDRMPDAEALTTAELELLIHFAKLNPFEQDSLVTLLRKNKLPHASTDVAGGAS
jgi:hypothetical protein